MINTCFANVYNEEYENGIYKIKFLIGKSYCLVTFLKIIAFWFIETGLQFSTKDNPDGTYLLTFEISLECAKSIREIERCVEFGADQVKFPYNEYSDYINRVFEAGNKRLSYES